MRNNLNMTLCVRLVKERDLMTPVSCPRAEGTSYARPTCNLGDPRRDAAAAPGGMLGGGRISYPKDMVCTSSGGMVKTLALSRGQSPLVV
ncbi:hypothetical protein THAOC_14471 [Thalassiosira oceanica]|uniref:Uncharacterized protein n=1 Tax=Thalassiosira oceanica TaxID=159749 RepID=K0SUS6_THAOC|nr:hypothetical protein THAOC_14471 [Thalassiosira oceanica]|eukprot:EJK64761.1 hypothetical protein THAOC_14471 [Thalassiosira oceanica]